MSESQKHIQIMTAAAETFSKYGYQKTTVDEIVKNAGISKGLFYHYYKGKNEIYMDLYHDYVQILSERLNKQVDLTQTDLFERLKQLTHLRIEFINEYPALWGFLHSAYYEEHPDVAPIIKEENELILKQSYSGAASGIDWSKLKPQYPPDIAMNMITWVAEGYVKKINEKKLTVSEDSYKEFDTYMDALKNGIYK